MLRLTSIVRLDQEGPSFLMSDFPRRASWFFPRLPRVHPSEPPPRPRRWGAIVAPEHRVYIAIEAIDTMAETFAFSYVSVACGVYFRGVTCGRAGVQHHGGCERGRMWARQRVVAGGTPTANHYVSHPYCYGGCCAVCARVCAFSMGDRWRGRGAATRVVLEPLPSLSSPPLLLLLLLVVSLIPQQCHNTHVLYTRVADTHTLGGGARVGGARWRVPCCVYMFLCLPALHTTRHVTIHPPTHPPTKHPQG